MSQDPLRGREFDLALNYLKRSDDAANYLRALVLALVLGNFVLIGNVIVKTIDRGAPIDWRHVLALILAGIATAFTFTSWDRQKKKAGRRFELLTDPTRREIEFPNDPALQADGLAAYHAYNNRIRSGSGLEKNHILDRAAYLCVIAALVFEGWSWFPT